LHSFTDDTEVGNVEGPGDSGGDSVVALRQQLAELEQQLESADALELASVSVKLGQALVEAGRVEEGLEVFGQVTERYKPAENPVLRQGAALALYKRAEALYGLGDWDAGGDALAALREGFGADSNLGVRGVVLSARAEEAGILVREKRFADALAVFDEIESSAADLPEEDMIVQIQRPIAGALAGKAELLEELGRWEDALAAHAEFLRRFSDSRDKEIQIGRCGVLAGKARVLLNLELYESAIETATRLLGQFATDPLPERGAVAEAVWVRTSSLMALGRDEEALASCDEFFERYWEDALPYQRMHALGIAAWIRVELGRAEEAIPLYDQALEMSDAVSSSTVALTLLRRTQALTDLGRHDEARLGLEDIITRYQDDSDDATVEFVARAREVLASKSS
jgi:tetratricopeptide (TPR) repeat protein